MNFGVTGEASPNAASSRAAKYSCADLFRLPLAAWNRSLLVGVGRNQAGVDRKPVGADQALGDATFKCSVTPGQR
jgi:hypothetical protein